jgi:hypothetical protein
VNYSFVFEWRKSEGTKRVTRRWKSKEGQTIQLSKEKNKKKSNCHQNTTQKQLKFEQRKPHHISGMKSCASISCFTSSTRCVTLVKYPVI